MSMMGRLNMILQEQAEELGFSTVQEALDAGYEAVGEQLLLPVDRIVMSEKETILDKLDGVIEYLKGEDDDPARYMVEELKDVERYIKEK